MAKKSKEIAEFGDFQTPEELATAACRLLVGGGVRPASVVEPTCGRGSFLFAALDAFPEAEVGIGIDINASYIADAEAKRATRRDATRIRFRQGDFFQTDWPRLISELPRPILVVGNPPWVTNAHLGSLGSSNLPKKSNFQGHAGFDAITGKANFDISEWMMIKLANHLAGYRATMALLCKTGVARKVLAHAWKNRLDVVRASVRLIDAFEHFDAAVDASLLTVDFGPGKVRDTAEVYDHFDAETPKQSLGYLDGSLIADVNAFFIWKHLVGEERMKWRSGIKHDCARVMELRREGDGYRNGLGELVTLEDEYLYPMLKSSDVAGRNFGETSRYMIVTQRSVGGDTAPIQDVAPRTWEYLQRHAPLLQKRGSAIYKSRPPFSVFGVGDYSFAPWKVAISGFYKRLAFTKVGCQGGKPIMTDDTCYFLPCPSEQAADLLAEMLNSDVARDFYGAFVFWDAKRPITVDLLGRLDLLALARQLRKALKFEELFGSTDVLPPRRKRPKPQQEATLW